MKPMNGHPKKSAVGRSVVAINKYLEGSLRHSDFLRIYLLFDSEPTWRLNWSEDSFPLDTIHATNAGKVLQEAGDGGKVVVTSLVGGECGNMRDMERPGRCVCMSCQPAGHHSLREPVNPVELFLHHHPTSTSSNHKVCQPKSDYDVVPQRTYVCASKCAIDWVSSTPVENEETSTVQPKRCTL